MLESHEYQECRNAVKCYADHKLEGLTVACERSLISYGNCPVSSHYNDGCHLIREIVLSKAQSYAHHCTDSLAWHQKGDSRHLPGVYSDIAFLPGPILRSVFAHLLELRNDLRE